MEFMNIIFSILGLGGLAAGTLIFQKFFSDDKSEKVQYTKKGKEEELRKDLDQIKKDQAKTNTKIDSIDKETKKKEEKIDQILDQAKKSMEEGPSSFSQTQEEIDKEWKNI